MRILILTALAANLGCFVFANAGESDQVEKRSFSLDGRRWATLFHDGLNVKHAGSVVSHVTTIRGKEFFEVLHNDDHDLTRWTVELGATNGFGHVQSINEARSSNLAVPSFTPWVDVQVYPNAPSTEDKPKVGWHGETSPQQWRTPKKPVYQESFTLALGERTIVQPNQPARQEVLRVQSYYEQRVRNDRITMSLNGPGLDDGKFKRLHVARNGVEGELDLNFTNAIGEIVGFTAAGDHAKIFVTTTALIRYTFDVAQVGTSLVFQMRGFAEEIREGLLAKPISRSAKKQMVNRPEPKPEECGVPLAKPAMAAE